MRAFHLLLVLSLGACGGATHTPTTPTAPTEDAAAGVRTPAFADLLREHWEAQLVDEPTLGTLIGDHRRDGEMPDLSPEAETARRARRADFLTRARALEAGLDPADGVTLRLFVDMLEAERGTEVCESHLWNASPMDNPLVGLNRLAEVHPFDSPEGGRTFLLRLRAYPRLIDQDLANLRAGAAAGRVAPRATLERVVAFARRTLAEPVEAWLALTHPTEAAASWPEAERDAFVRELRSVLDIEVRVAFLRWADTLETELVPVGRDADHEGVSNLPDGAACYEARIRRHTTLSRTAADLHALGESEIARTDARLLELGAPMFSVTTVPEVLEHLRTDPALGYASGDAIVADATARIREAEGIAPRFFGLRATVPCDVHPIPPAEAASTGFAFYVPGTPDGSRAGAYYVNTAEPESRRRHLLAAVTAHEAVPGHHFQITVAHALPDMPMFRRHAEFTAYVEGWGLYAERLADEMGLYHDDVDRIGAVDLEAFRAARLVVDTGLHAMGWTRARAEAYLLEHTSMSPDIVVAEVDRYLNWPGQALAYKVGQLELLALRAEAEAALGDRFDPHAFHDLVLGLGSVSLPILGEEVRAWIARTIG